MKTLKELKKQSGFALIEVMLAALVMVVGGVAFLKLQQTGLQFGFNNYARTEGVALAENFAEQLRGNIGLLKSSQASGTIIQGKITKGTALSSNTPNCESSENEQSCSASVLAMHSFVLSQQMNALASNSALCYLERAPGTGHMRITYTWQDNSRDGKEAGVNCPGGFNDQINLNNSVTVYVQL